MKIEVKISIGEKPFWNLVNLDEDEEIDILNILRETIAKFQHDLVMVQTSPNRKDLKNVESPQNYPFHSSFATLKGTPKARYLIRNKKPGSTFRPRDLISELEETSPEEKPWNSKVTAAINQSKEKGLIEKLEGHTHRRLK